MNYYEQIREIKKGSTFNFMKIKCDDKTITLQIVDDSDETINLLLQWRNEYWNWFETKFTGTFERTKKWVNEEIIKNPDRVLFLIIFDGCKIGHVGVSRYDENEGSIWLENFIRVGTIGPPRLMLNVTKMLLKWLLKDLKLNVVKGQLFSDNLFSNALCMKCGFEIIKKIPLMKIITEDGWKWMEMKMKYENEPVERYQNMIEITRERYLSNESSKYS